MTAPGAAPVQRAVDPEESERRIPGIRVEGDVKIDGNFIALVGMNNTVNMPPPTLPEPGADAKPVRTVAIVNGDGNTITQARNPSTGPQEALPDSGAAEAQFRPDIGELIPDDEPDSEVMLDELIVPYIEYETMVVISGDNNVVDLAEDDPDASLRVQGKNNTVILGDRVLMMGGKVQGDEVPGALPEDGPRLGAEAKDAADEDWDLV